MSLSAVLVETPVVLSGGGRELWNVISAGAPGLSEIPVWSLSAALSLFLAAVLGNQLQRRRQQDQPGQPYRSESYFQALIENALDIITVMDREGTILYESPANQRILGYTPEETIGRSAFEFIHPDDLPRVRRVFEEGIREPGSTRSLEFRTRHKDGSWRFIEAIGRNLLDDPDVAAVIINSRDITQRREAEETLRQVQDELERRVQQRTSELLAANEALKSEVGERERAERETGQRAYALQESEAKLQAILDHTTACVFAKDLQGRYMIANRSVAELFGWPDGEYALGKTDCELYDAETAAAFMANDQRVLEVGEPLEVEELVPRGDEMLTFLVLKFPLRDRSGAIYGVCGIATDITERKRAMEQLRASEQELADFFEHAPMGLHWVGPDGIILRANQAELDLLGYAADEYVGRHIAEFHIDRDVIDDILRRLQAGEELQNYESRMRCREGSIRDVLIDSNVFWENGEFIHTRCFTRDITRQKESERALARQTQALRAINEDLRRKNEELEQFVYTVSHDLKSPLVTILGFIGLLKEDLENDPGEGRLDSCRRIERAAERMHQTIDELLQLSRIGRYRNELVNVDVASLLDDLRQELRETFSQQNVEFHVESDLPRVVADRQRLRQAFENLLTNALQYGCRGPDPKIAVGSETADGEIRYFVRDNGPGISPAYHERIFGLFQRLDTQRDGTGVGLALVTKIARIHGGRTWVESAPGRGATFWIAFPAEAIVQKSTEPD